MSDYIKREDAEKLFDEYRPMMAIKTCEYGIELKKIPSADVAPVRHGRWIKISPAGIYECSECGKNVMTSDIEAYEYCHGCGAIMDAKE